MAPDYGVCFCIQDAGGKRLNVYFDKNAGRKRTEWHGTYGRVRCAEGHWTGTTLIHLCTQTPCPRYKEPWTYRPRDEQPEHVTLVLDPVVAGAPASGSSPTLVLNPVVAGSSASGSSSSSSASSSSSPRVVDEGAAAPPGCAPATDKESETPSCCGNAWAGGGEAAASSETSRPPPTPPSPPAAPPPLPPPKAPESAPGSAAPAEGSSIAVAPHGLPNDAIRCGRDDVIAVAEHCFRKPFSFVGLTAPIVLGCAWGQHVRVFLQDCLVDPVAMRVPWLQGAVVAAAGQDPHATMFLFAWTRIEATTTDNEWVVSLPAALDKGNHWVPLIRTHPRERAPPHHACGGRLCGSGSSHVCCSPLAEMLAPCGLRPYNVQADGDCFFHAALYLRGVRHEGPGGALNRASLRNELADWLSAQKEQGRAGGLYPRNPRLNTKTHARRKTSKMQSIYRTCQT